MLLNQARSVPVTVSRCPGPGIIVVNCLGSLTVEVNAMVEGINVFTPIFSPDIIPTVTLYVKVSPNGTSTGPVFVWTV